MFVVGCSLVGVELSEDVHPHLPVPGREGRCVASLNATIVLDAALCVRVNLQRVWRILRVRREDTGPLRGMVVPVAIRDVLTYIDGRAEAFVYVGLAESAVALEKALGFWPSQQRHEIDHDVGGAAACLARGEVPHLHSAFALGVAGAENLDRTDRTAVVPQPELRRDFEAMLEAHHLLPCLLRPRCRMGVCAIPVLVPLHGPYLQIGAAAESPRQGSEGRNAGYIEAKHALPCVAF
mmetsp:Transcript_59287/g.165521  ORF Transcript_59287/g.165521 Transcript_59287/m.165521 type:complete len:237 (+) Transcript_59287:640-1350(+)